MHDQLNMDLETSEAEWANVLLDDLCDPYDGDPLNERVAAFKEIYVRHPRVKRVEKDLDRLLRTPTLGGKKGSAMCYLLTGETGWGKTTILQNFAALHKERITPQRTLRPVLYVELVGTAKPKGVAIALLNALGVPIPKNAPEYTLTALVQLHLLAQGVRVVILDESQNFVDQKDHKLNFPAAEFLKGLLNSSSCAYVFAGMPATRAIFDGHRQMLRRSFTGEPLEDFDRLDEKQFKEFKSILEHLLKEAPLPFEGADGDELTLAFFAACSGRVGIMVDFIAKASIFAADDGRDVLGIDDFAEAAERLKSLSDPGWQNPFLLGPAALLEELDRLEEVERCASYRFNLRNGKRQARVKDVLVD